MSSVKVRIAVAVDDLGNWGSIGHSGMPAECMAMASDNLDGAQTQWYWVSADLTLPTPRPVLTAEGEAEATEPPVE